MRGKWNHKAPKAHQGSPADNTSPYVFGQVKVWRESGELIHPETAMEIAAWHHSPSPHDAGIAAFASTGTITDSLLSELERELAKAAPQGAADTARELGALIAYVKKARKK